MGKRILIVGGVAGGASTAARARRIDESAEIIMFERGPHVSFSNCALPFYLSGTVSSSDKLVLMTPERFKKQYAIEARVNQEVTAVNRAEKTIAVRNVETGEEYTEKYDVLVLSPGAVPVVPASIKGVHGENVFTIRNVVDIEKLKSYIDANQIQEVTVAGGGFIGIEAAENLTEAGVHVTLVEAADQVMAPFDYDMAQILQKEMLDQGMNVITGDGIAEITDSEVVLNSGRRIPSGCTIMAIGVRPETTLARAAELEIGETGGIKVNHNYQTSDPSIYAVGDVVEVYNQLTMKPSRLALAGPAQRQARAAADHMYGIPHQNKGVIGSSCIRVFHQNAASTGLSVKAAKQAGIPCDFVYVLPADHVGLIPGSHPMHFKLVFEVPTGRILGAQAIGMGAVDKRIDVIATMISMKGTLEDLKELELCYSPVFSTAKDVVNYAALVGLNILYGRYRQVPVSQVRSLVESNACIVDVREAREYAAGHLLNAVNIPLSELRDRVNEIPKDRPVYLHCRSSQRSYNAVMALQGMGYDNVYNISGSYLGICCYEYYEDQMTGREKIVTAYNFN
ncbi:MAG: FAD-dependent oxidoreductase [Lachnospiraceae bacterium]|nr:FAD-dependent oxidoreductase [Lachnospiraceae bacterium]